MVIQTTLNSNDINLHSKVINYVYLESGVVKCSISYDKSGVDYAKQNDINVITGATFSEVISLLLQTHFRCFNNATFGVVIVNCNRIAMLSRALTGGTTITFDDNSTLDVTDINSYIIEAVNNSVNNLDRTTRFEFYEDFLLGSVVANNRLIAYSAGTGVGINNISPTREQSVGIVQFSTGTTSTGRYGLGTSLNLLMLGDGLSVFETNVLFPTLSTSGERYQSLFGFLNTSTAINQTNGVYVLYDEGGVSLGSVASNRFQLVTVNTSIRTFTDSGITVEANRWYKLRVFLINGVAYLYINNNFACSTTLNINKTTTFMFGNFIYKSVGTTARTVQNDYIHVYKTYSSET